MPRSRFGLIKAIIWQRTLFGKPPISKEPFWQAIIIWQKYLWQAVFLLCQNSMWYKAVESFGSSIVSRNLNQSNVMLTIVWSLNLKHHSTQRIYNFNRENPQNSESQNGPRRGIDFIALTKTKCRQPSTMFIDTAQPNQSSKSALSFKALWLCDFDIGNPVLSNL